MAPAATIMPLTVIGLMTPATPCEMAVTLEPDRDEPTWTGREVRSGEWACGGEGVGGVGDGGTLTVCAGAHWPSTSSTWSGVSSISPLAWAILRMLERFCTRG